MGKRIAMLFLSFCLTVTSMPVTASAAQNTDTAGLTVEAEAGVGTALDNDTAEAGVETASDNDTVEAERITASGNGTEPEAGGEAGETTPPEEPTTSGNDTESEAGSETGDTGEAEDPAAPEEPTTSGNDTETDTDTAPEDGTASGNDTVSSNDTVSANDTISANDTLSGNDTVSGNDTGHGFLTAEEYEEALQALLKLADEKPIMALVYLSDYYAVREEPSIDSRKVVSVPSGQQVHIIGFEATDTTVWYETEFIYNGETYTGYIERYYLASSDELFLEWENTYLKQPITEEKSTYAAFEYETFASPYADVETFPFSYQEALRALKAQHPNWTFVKMNTGRDWNGCVSEQVGNYSWIYRTAKDEFKGAQINADWHYATKKAIAYYMDPRNFLTQSDIFQFEQNTYNASYHTQEALQEFLNATFMSGAIPNDDAGRTYAAVIFASGQKRGLSPFNLAARVVQEQGVKGTSPMISGTYAGYEGYYNYYNIGASGKTDAEVLKNGLTYAKNQGWNTRYKSLDGGAAFIGNGYILKGQDTLYLQKFDLEKRSGSLHQYMQNIQAPLSEGRSMRKMYESAGAMSSRFVFKIPVFNSMPNEFEPVPLESIELSSTSLQLADGDSRVLEVTFLPANTTDAKTVIWTTTAPDIVEITELSESSKIRITAKKSGKAKLQAFSTVSPAITTECEITVSNPVQTITFDKESLTITEGEKAQIVLTTLPVAADETEVRLYSPDELTAAAGPLTKNVDGTYTAEITAKAAGTVLLKAAAGMAESTCMVTVLPKEAGTPEGEIPKEADVLSPVTKQFYLQAYAYDKNDSAVVQIQNQYEELLDAGLFDYTSADEDIVHVSESGVITVNPAYEPRANKTVNVTASLKNDGAGRKAVVKVTIPAKEQVSRVTIQQTAGGQPTEEMKELYKEGMQFTLYQESTGADGKQLDTKVKWAVSDTAMASVKEDGSGTAVVSIKAPGIFKVTCTAQDTLKNQGAVTITTVASTPLLEQSAVTYNKKHEAAETDNFRLEPVYDTTIQNVKIESVSMGGKLPLDSTAFRVKEQGDHTYSIAFTDKAYADSLAKGSYTIQLAVTTSAYVLHGETAQATHVLPLTMKVTDSAPKVTVKTPTFNLFYMDETGRKIEAPILADGTITDIAIEDSLGNGISNYVKPVRENGVWYLVFEDNNGTYDASSIKGKVHVTVDGYMTVSKSITVKTPVKKPAIVQTAVPSVDRKLDDTAVVELQNKTLKQSVPKFIIIEETSKYLTSAVDAAGRLHVTIRPEVSWKNGASYTSKVRLQAPNWKEPIDVTVRLKAYTAAPKVTVKAGTLTLNNTPSGRAETAATIIGTDRVNTSILPSSEWKVSMYDTASRQYVVCGEDAGIRFSYHAGERTLYAGFSQAVQSGTEKVERGTYKFRLSHIVDGYPAAYKDISVKVVDSVPSASIRVSGRLDMIDRAGTELTGKVTLKNITGEVEGVVLLNDDKTAPSTTYYAVAGRERNTFGIKAGTNARLQGKTTTVPVKIILSGGTVLYTKVSFKPQQKVPKVVTPPVQTLYKSGAAVSRAYDFGEGLASGVRIDSVKIMSAPKELETAVQDGVVNVSLKDRSLKPGMYRIKAAVYFQGAQYVKGYPKGKPVIKTLSVRVR